MRRDDSVPCLAHNYIGGNCPHCRLKARRAVARLKPYEVDAQPISGDRLMRTWIGRDRYLLEKARGTRPR